MKVLETLIQTIRIYRQDIGMEFGIEKCALLIMKSERRETAERIELPNQERIRTLGGKKNKYLEILKTDTIKQAKIKEKEKYHGKLLETKFCSRNLYKGLNTLIASPVILKIDTRRTLTNGTKDKKVDNDAQSLIFKRCHSLFV